MLSKEDLISWAKKEFTTTLTMLKAYPAEKGEFKPSDNSRPARDIARTFVFELYLLGSYVLGEKHDPNRFKEYSPDFATLIKDFEEQSVSVITRLEALNAEDFKREVEFAGHKMHTDRFAFMMILDQIHHRGQLSIYVRLAGGKIPSVYGPTADDPTTNID